MYHNTTNDNNNNQGRVAQLVERSLSMFPSMRKVLGSIPSSSIVLLDP